MISTGEGHAHEEDEVTSTKTVCIHSGTDWSVFATSLDGTEAEADLHVDVP